ncbi:hypothetical protein FACS1894188_05620 [Clostridia bacterium]|nr:hypothetical protein FACS1894188_05620 [Clostridia bacterium]
MPKETEKVFYATFGALATGKSTLLEAMRNNYIEYEYATDEKILERDSPLYNYHKKLFEDRDYSYFFRFQMGILPIRFQLANRCRNKSLLDETIYDALAYSRAVYHLEWLPKEEFNIFFDNFKILESFYPKPTAIIFLKCTNVYTILHRMSKRGRPIEKKFTLEYIEALMNAYDEIALELVKKNIKVVTIDVTDLREEEVYYLTIKGLEEKKVPLEKDVR